MSKKASHKGPHKYQKVALGKKGYMVYKCILLNCTHHMPSIEMMLGKLTLCHLCNDELSFTREMLVAGREVTKPFCPSCRVVRLRAREALMNIGMPAMPGEDYDFSGL